jgi:hypothetical protein
LPAPFGGSESSLRRLLPRPAQDRSYILRHTGCILHELPAAFEATTPTIIIRPAPVVVALDGYLDRWVVPCSTSVRTTAVSSNASLTTRTSAHDVRPAAGTTLVLDRVKPCIEGLALCGYILGVNVP